MSAPKPIQHGTANGARQHYRRGEKPCDPCRMAANAVRHGKDPYAALAPAQSGAPRNGLPIVAYQWRSQAYPWAVAAIRRTEAVYGSPENLECAS